MLVSDIITRVRRSFGDNNSVEVTDSDIIRWINDGMREITYQLELLQVKATAATVAGTSNYDLPGDLLKLHSIKWQGSQLQFVSLEQAEQLIPYKDNTAQFPTGTPTHYWVWGQQLYLYPAPSSAGSADLEAYYNRYPVEIASPTDTPELPTIYHNRIVEYCMAQAYELDENVFVAELKRNELSNNIQQMKSLNEWEDQDAYPFITSSAEDAGYSYPVSGWF